MVQFWFYIFFYANNGNEYQRKENRIWTKDKIELQYILCLAKAFETISLQYFIFILF